MNRDNSSMKMDPGLAQKLFTDGGVLAIAAVPKGTKFGIDLCSYVVGEKFRGVKMIPSGPHYVWCATTGPYDDVGARVGFVHFFKDNEIVVREWDHQNEELRERVVQDPDLEKQRIREHLRDLDRFLAPYDFRYWQEWRQLTDAITESCVERCRPALGVIRTNMELQSCPDSERPRGGAAKGPTGPQHPKAVNDESDLLPDLKPIEGTAPRFATVPDRVPKDAEPADISRHFMDCFAALESLVHNCGSTNALIEEVQISFVFFYVGHSVESLEHWRKILSLLANSETAIEKYKLLFMKYSEVLAFQLPRLPEELMAPTPHNKVFKDVRSLLVNLSIGGLAPSADRLAKKLKKSMNWEFGGLLDDDPEDLPVVVEDI